MFFIHRDAVRQNKKKKMYNSEWKKKELNKQMFISHSVGWTVQTIQLGLHYIIKDLKKKKKIITWAIGLGRPHSPHIDRVHYIHTFKECFSQFCCCCLCCFCRCWATGWKKKNYIFNRRSRQCELRPASPKMFSMPNNLHACHRKIVIHTNYTHLSMAHIGRGKYIRELTWLTVFHPIYERAYCFLFAIVFIIIYTY